MSGGLRRGAEARAHMAEVAREAQERARFVGPLPFVRVPVAASEGGHLFRGPFISRASVPLRGGDRILLVVQDDEGNDLAYVSADAMGRRMGGIVQGETIILEGEAETKA